MDRYPPGNKPSNIERNLSFALRKKADLYIRISCDDSVPLDERISRFHTFRSGTTSSSRIDLIFAKSQKLCKFRHLLDNFHEISGHLSISFSIKVGNLAHYPGTAIVELKFVNH